ncbi:TlpA family protein disulfide reductase [Oricola sp.]|uniref:TlpA family protein disulfide reductase n=1 Tax=Oricola sp. TaxID=1979950 RepID=UPI003BAAF682
MRAVITAALLVAAALPAVADGADCGWIEEKPRQLPFADIEVGNLVGHTHVLADFLPLDRPVILHVWATDCKDCRTELPQLADYAANLKRQARRDSLIVIAADPAPAATITRFVNDLGLDGFITLHDRQDRLEDAFGFPGLPATLVVDASGHLIARRDGPYRWAEAPCRAALDTFIAE